MSTASLAEATPSSTTLFGQKLMLDFRYYCQQGKSETCRTPMTQLPPELADIIARYDIGGVILFSENTADTAQIVKLTNDLQLAASHSPSKLPLFIAIDQEGGRVARINRAQATSFTGNMSIGATFPRKGSHYASAVATVIGKELNSLGVNVNFAPTVDVNVNPLNPVINVRSFGENPDIVATLGAAQVNAFEQQGVLSALKHFPGHGDTHVDSHTGLPIVHHDKATITAVDLKPFTDIIRSSPPAMIMTAHIQYPALDDSLVTNMSGQKMLRPATMSRKIMTNLLRNELNYQGITITDALDMAGISHFFSPAKATIETFKAGVDIALMPLAIRTPKDVVALTQLFTELENAVKSGELNHSEQLASYQRIATLKRKLDKTPRSVAIAETLLGAPEHRQLEAALALDAITQVKNQGIIPLRDTAKRIHIIMPDTRKCLALQQALSKLSPTQRHYSCTSLQAFAEPDAIAAIKAADIVIAAHASPLQSAVEIGGMEDVQLLQQHKLNAQQQPLALKALLNTALDHKKPTIFISLRAPYEIAQFAPLSQAVLASYAYNVDVDTDQIVSGPAFSALAKVILGLASANGSLPVTIMR
ncbi:glycoside hydrolase family 3 protein [Pseudoalteromonas fenneropenaei]|uniref:beta-N-acetylhexosaminidase n=1 Tax=Pseudoalteromonas fenneropenaei TaxID=1737459 RepID=A0ABV7CFW1_9GAMM